VIRFDPGLWRRIGLCTAIRPAVGHPVITSTAAKAERLKVLGASDVINYAETPNWDEKARELTDGRGCGARNSLRQYGEGEPLHRPARSRSGASRDFSDMAL
jgi:hypothetical protein